MLFRSHVPVARDDEPGVVTDEVDGHARVDGHAAFGESEEIVVPYQLHAATDDTPLSRKVAAPPVTARIGVNWRP